MLAEGEAESDRIRAIALRIRQEVEAEGQRLFNEAQNVLSPESRASMLRRLLIERLEAIVRESVRPLEKIDEIKIFQIDGMNSAAPAANGSNGGYPHSLSDQIVNSALRYRAQGPLIDKLLKELGLPTASLPQLMSGDIGMLIDPDPPATEHDTEPKKLAGN
ncbi:MAG: hypothetical protein HC774_01515 [Sphingomonadales bacterium]|nr:hypothetical protein [Sphingomonadales bacterium]